MLNAEKFLEEIKDVNYTFALKENKILKCDSFEGCDGCAFQGSCWLNRTKWLLEEYEEPILSQEGKDCLKQMIAPFKPNQVTSVIKGDRNFYIYFGSNCTVYDNETLDEKMELFKKMNDCKEYKLEELGL